MARGVVDHEGMRGEWAEALRQAGRPVGMPFRITRIGHVVLRVTDLERSVGFYTELLGLEVSDVYPPTMMPGGMVFMRCNTDHHGVALVGGATGPVRGDELHHLAFEVGTLDEVIRARDLLRARDVPIDFEGRRRAGCQIAVEFRDPDGHRLEIYWGLDQIGSDGRPRSPEQWREALSLADALANPPIGQDTTLQDPDLVP
ncbi:MAG: VOC family protein [Ectothiorhodospiraceae bacterium]|nr:VOC family protein [Chromatiales bacterium]MCP5156356.1 VOC family protein [Ectothiorhodospiraceae bacterium]